MSEDKGGILWFLLGFILPIVGFILWLVWKNSKPNRASSLIKGAVVGFVIGVAVGIYQRM